MLPANRECLGDAEESGAGRVVGYAAGVFDLFHIGHLNLLRNASERCDYLIAGVLTDDLTEERKGVRPMVPFEERLAIVSAIRYVDRAVPEDVPSKLDMWERLQFDLVIKGTDWQGTRRGRKLEANFTAHGVEVLYLPYTHSTSSTQLRVALDRLAGVA